MVARTDLTGRKFGRLFVLRRETRRIRNRSEVYWVCRCTCAAQRLVTILGTSLRSGATTSCGCVRSEKMAERTRAYGRQMREREDQRRRQAEAEDEIFGTASRRDPSLEPRKTWAGANEAARDLAAALGMIR